MAQKTRLRENRAGTIINLTSKQMEKDVIVALQQTILYIERKFAVRLLVVVTERVAPSSWHFTGAIPHLRRIFPVCPQRPQKGKRTPTDARGDSRLHQPGTQVEPRA